MDYVKEYGLELVKNASGDPDKEPDVQVKQGVIVLNKAASESVNLKACRHLLVRAGRQTGATIFALEFATANNDTIEAKLQKNGVSRIPFRKPLKKYGLSLTESHSIDLIQCEEGILVFAILTAMPEKKEEPKTQTDTVSAGPTAPFGPIGSEFGVQQTVLEGSDF